MTNKNTTIFVGIENSGQEIYGGFSLHIINIDKRTMWQISLVQTEKEILEIHKITLRPIVFIRKTYDGYTPKWICTSYPCNAIDVGGPLGKFNTTKEAIRMLFNSF